LPRRLRAGLSDETRLHALALIAEKPRSTQELAPLVGLTEAGLSKHLRILADAGVVTSKRDGYYVLYSIAPSPRPCSSSSAHAPSFRARGTG
jgi:DNA-binding transcriptional ArsR family regulator